MNIPLSFTRAAVLVAALAMAGAACTSSTTVGAESTIAPTAIVVAQNPAPAETPSADPVPAEPTSSPVVDSNDDVEVEISDAPAASQGVVEVVFDDGRSWTLQQTECRASQEGAVQLDVSGVGDGTLELNAISTRALGDFTNDDAEQIFIASFVDEDDTLYVFEDPETIESGADGNVSFTVKAHSNIWYALGDAPAAIATISC